MPAAGMSGTGEGIQARGPGLEVPGRKSRSTEGREEEAWEEGPQQGRWGKELVPRVGMSWGRRP